MSLYTGDHNQNEQLRAMLPDLYGHNGERAQRDAQKAAAQQFFHDLEHAAWQRTGDVALGAAAANMGLVYFFRRCAKSQLEREDAPLGHLFKCVYNAANKELRKKFLYRARLNVRAISPLDRQCEVIVPDHGLTLDSEFKLSRTNSVPTVNGTYGGANGKAFRIIDRDSIEIGEFIKQPGNHGYLHLDRRIPERPLADDRQFADTIDATDTRRLPELLRVNGLNAEDLELFQRAWNRLDERQQWILVMKAEGATHEEIGESIGRTKESVRKTDFPKAAEALRLALNAERFDPTHGD